MTIKSNNHIVAFKKILIASLLNLMIHCVILAVFLGISFFLAAVHIPFVTNAPAVKGEKSDGTLTGSVDSQCNSFILWNKATVMRRIAWLQAAAVSLGVGILLLHIPYLKIPDKALWLLMGIGLGLIILIPLLVWWVTVLRGRNKVPGAENALPCKSVIFPLLQMGSKVHAEQTLK